MIVPNPCCCDCKTFTSTDYVNETTVPNPVSGGTPANIPPYPRSNLVDNAPDPLCGTTDYPACGQWPVAERPAVAAPSDVLHDWNKLSAGEGRTETICPTTGHKVVQALKEWHGRLPFNFCPEGCAVMPARYRKMSWNITVKRQQVYYDPTSGPPQNGYVITETGVMTATVTVDRYSGKKTLSGCTLGTSVNYQAGIPDDGKTWFPNAFGTADACLQLASIRFNCGYYTSVEDGSDSHVVYRARVALNLYLDGMNPSPDPGNTYVTAESDAADSIHGVIKEKASVGDGSGSQIVVYYPEDWDFTISLDDAYTADQVKTDTLDLLDHWDLREHQKLPWRTDSLRSLGVICRYHEETAQSPDIGTPTCDYVDPSDKTGAMIGEPFDGLPDHMYGADHATWRCKRVDASQIWFIRFYVAEAGNSSPDGCDGVIPKTASVWTENYPAGLLYPGSWAWWSGNGSETNRLTLQKSAEVTEPFPSYNFFGPCGHYRHRPDVAVASCISYSSGDLEAPTTGDVIHLEDDLSATLSPGDDVVIFGTTLGAPTRWTLSAVSGPDVTLGTQDTNARNLEDAVKFWTDIPDIDLGSGVLAKVRTWKRSGVAFQPPAVCGKIAVTAAQDLDEPTKVKITLSSAAKYLQVGDKIIFVQGDASDTVNNNHSGAGWTITDVVSNTVFKFTGTYDPLTMLGCVKSLGAPLAKWNTTARRRTGVWNAWDEDGAFTQSDYDYKGTKVLASTPNGDVEAGAKTHDFPTVTAKTCDTIALTIPVQYVVHPLYQTPFGCSGTAIVCPPKVEALSATQLAAILALGAPALPDDCTFNISETLPSPLGCDCETAQPIPFESPWNLCLAVTEP